MNDKNEAFLEAYEAHSDAIYRFCLFKLSNAELAKDMVQETFMKVWIYLAKGESVENTRALLYKTAGNLVIDQYRQQARRKGKSESLEVLNEAGFEPSFDETQSIIDRIDGAEAMALISQVPDPYGETIFMRYVQNLEISEIVSITGESDNTVSVRIHRGLEKLRKIFLKQHA
ncbi:MAG TPA: RNA polymerase sigma factor [Candidatus Paceibacterota bacterium]